MSGNPIAVSSVHSLSRRGIARAVIAIGVFDGVHRGHQRLLGRLSEMSEKYNAARTVVTFYPHPRHVLHPSEPVKLLMRPEKKIELLAEYGVEAVVTIPFTMTFSEKSADEFMDEYLICPGLEICGICVGREWKFGRDGEGDSELLHKFADKGNFEFRPISELELEGVTVSSTAVRRAVSAGKLELAAEFLGRNYSISGRIEKGEMKGAPLLGYPTANISIENLVVPPRGVYAAFAKLDGGKYKAAVDIGTAPSVKHLHPHKALIEAHLLDFNGDIYGRDIEIEFVKHIREERFYSMPESLKTQIGNDIEKVREILA